MKSQGRIGAVTLGAVIEPAEKKLERKEQGGCRLYELKRIYEGLQLNFRF